ncbi:F-box domain-containing protein [Mycena indigotica]|uniref:F-box domain-containing protein n=1 Tax=Mycena indigotica TaxID=2126181 RepID=A0A8H6SCZ1_9AGAR|nr:F-box domain-containing protein [Mycena indigotica]KAF7295600.1 F-box domain-containing protein [Mycena indigotica]
MPPPTVGDAWLKDRRFGIVVDAGSSGSRVQIYSWRDPRTLEVSKGSRLASTLPKVEKGTRDGENWMFKVEPGISSFADKPQQIADHLRPLLAHARNLIPPSLQHETPLFLLATAGMRLLPPEKQATLLQDACTFLVHHSEFKIDGPSKTGPCGSSVRIITGEEEGLFGWIAVNYLMDGFQAGQTTYGFLDMGGASTQIAFEPQSAHVDDEMTLIEVRLRRLSGEEIHHKVFVTTWLGYGTNQARERYVGQAITDHEKSRGEGGDDVVHDPCLPLNLELAEHPIHTAASSDHAKKTHKLLGTGSFEQCMRKTAPLLNKSAPCPDTPCLMNGVHVPTIDFSVSHFIGVSEYWYSSEHVFGLGGPYDFVQYERAASKFCSRNWADILKEHDKSGHRHSGDGEVEKDGKIVEVGNWSDKVEVSRLQMQCFKAAWVANVLHDGIGMPRIIDKGGNNTTDGEKVAVQAEKKGLGRPTFQSVDTVGDIAISWTLGKMVLEASKEVVPLVKSTPPIADPLEEPANSNSPIKPIQLPGIRETIEDTLEDHLPAALTREELGFSPVMVLLYLLMLIAFVLITYPLMRRLRSLGLRLIAGRERRGVLLEEGKGGLTQSNWSRWIRRLTSISVGATTANSQRPTSIYVPGNGASPETLPPPVYGFASTTSRSPSPGPAFIEVGEADPPSNGLSSRSRNPSYKNLEASNANRFFKTYLTRQLAATTTTESKMSSRPSVILQPSVSTTTVTTTTTTTTTYAPIPLPPLPTPIEPTDPKEYPLLHASLPSSLRKFPLVFPGGTRATFRDSDGDSDNGEGRPDYDDERDSHGEGWRMLRRDDPPEPVVGLVEAVERYGKKRAWGEGGESPSRKKPRPPPSPPGSRQGSPFEPDLALTTLLTLPSLVSHFTALPPALQSHFLLTLLRHSPLPVLRNVHSVLTPTLARDFLTLLPPELGSHILSFLPFPTLARAARVSKSWRALIDADPLVWTSLLKSYGMFWGSEAAFLRAHRRLPYPHRALFQSRYLTQARWATAPAPVHRSFLAHGSSVVTCLILSKGRVISASDDHSIHVYDPLSGEQKHALQGHEGGVWALAATGDMLVSGSTDRTVRIWDLVSGRCTHVFGGHTSTVRCLSIVHPEWIEMDNGRREKWPKRALIVTGSRDHTLRVWTLPRPDDTPYSCFDEGDPEDAEDNPYHRHHLQGHDHAVRALAARGRTLVSGSYDSTVRVWDLVSGDCRWVLAGHTQKVYSVVLDPMRDQACSGSMDGTVRIWDLKTGRCAHTLTGHTSLVGLLGLSPRTLVSAAADSTLRVWDPTTGALLHTLAAHTGAITCFQHDEFKVLSGSDGTLKMWNIRDGSVTRDLLTGITGVWQVVFEGRWCVAASNQTRGGTVQTVLDVWDFAGEGEDWVGEPPGGVYDEGSDSDADEEDDQDSGVFRRGMDMVVEEDDDTEQDVDAMAMDDDQDIILRSRSASRVAESLIEVDEPGEGDIGVGSSIWAPPLPSRTNTRRSTRTTTSSTSPPSTVAGPSKRSATEEAGGSSSRQRGQRRSSRR